MIPKLFKHLTEKRSDLVQSIVSEAVLKLVLENRVNPPNDITNLKNSWQKKDK